MTMGFRCLVNCALFLPLTVAASPDGFNPYASPKSPVAGPIPSRKTKMHEFPAQTSDLQKATKRKISGETIRSESSVLHHGAVPDSPVHSLFWRPKEPDIAWHNPSKAPESPEARRELSCEDKTASGKSDSIAQPSLESPYTRLSADPHETEDLEKSGMDYVRPTTKSMESDAREEVEKQALANYRRGRRRSSQDHAAQTVEGPFRFEIHLVFL
jgi:hypothetical protein